MSQPYHLLLSKGIQVLRVESLLSEYTNRSILEAAQQQIDNGFHQFIVDLEGMAYTNSVGLNFIISLQARCQEHGGDIVVANASTKIMQLLEITKLHEIFHLSNSVEDAFQQLQLL